MDKLKEVEREYFIRKYKWIFFLGIFFILIVIILILLNVLFCNDWTLRKKCSDIPPFFCENNKLVSKAFLCGCPEGLIRDGDFCISEYSENFKNISLNYFLNGKEGIIEFIVDEGFYNHTINTPRFLSMNENYFPTINDFKLMGINNEEQKNMILPLVAEIKNRAIRRDTQAKIAISLVQNINYEFSEKEGNFFGQKINYSRYPYEVLYENKGVCGEKASLLSLLLKELGYGVVIFYYPKEKHEAVGIKCHHKDFENTGYCFIETTGRLEGNNYLGATQEFTSKPEIIFVSEGKSIGYWF